MPIRKKDFKLAISDPNAHNGILQHAIDFPLPEGTEIISAYDGIVINTKSNSSKGGLEKKYNHLKYLNFIVIKHKNNEYSEYSHLKFKSVFVKKGQRVKVGEVIGYSGNTGYSSSPHLHFHVCTRGSLEDIGETLDIQFSKPFKIKRKESDLTENDKKLLGR